MALYEIIQWPEIQDLMERVGFQDNAYLVNDEQGINEFGSSAYFVNKEWLNEVTESPKQKVYIVSTLAESQDDAPSDYHRVFANYFDAIHYKSGEIEECMCGKDINAGEIINDFQTLYEWRSDTEAVTVCIEEQELR